MAVTSLGEARALLYGHPADSFIAERDALVKSLRSAKNRDLANEVRALRKPSVVAAEVNRIVRADPAGVELILQAAEFLRSAQAGIVDEGVNVGALQQQYRAAIQALAQTAESKRVEVQTALAAATIDQASNEALRTGSLVSVPNPVAGFGGGAVAAPPTDELAVRRAQRKAKTKPAPDVPVPTTPATKSKTTDVQVDKATSTNMVVDIEQAQRLEAAATKQVAAEQAAAEQAANERAAAKRAATERAAAEKAEAKRIAAQAKAAKKERAKHRKKLAKEHREALRNQLAALDEQQAATTAAEAQAATVDDLDHQVDALEPRLVELRESLEQARSDLAEAEQTRATAADRAAQAEAAVQDLTSAIDAIDAHDAT